jgi:hypothetical protein
MCDSVLHIRLVFIGTLRRRAEVDKCSGRVTSKHNYCFASVVVLHLHDMEKIIVNSFLGWKLYICVAYM